MIDEIVKIHDKFSLEIKLGFNARRKKSVSDFACNLWMFVPNSLDINSATYNKTDFYRDIKTNIRLTTPVFLLRDIADRKRSPFTMLEQSFNNLASAPTRTHMAEYEYQIKMFLSIVKTSLRNEINHISGNNIQKDLHFLIGSYVDSIKRITYNYRSLRRIINAPTISRQTLDYFLFGDEFISNLIEQHTFKLLGTLPGAEHAENDSVRQLHELIRQEVAYKKANGFLTVKRNNPTQNTALLFRLGLLKKYAENELFLEADKKKDGAIAEQVYLSLAAGLSMIFATAIAFSFQQRFGNFTMPFFVALVVSYMMKDRIKELSRSYFAVKLGKRHFDLKTKIRLNEFDIGWSKEAMDFIPESRLPAEVLRIRSRTPIIEATNRGSMERIILFRKLVRINRRNIDRSSRFSSTGVSEIIRMNFMSFISKMDNPYVPLYVTDEDQNIMTVKGEKIYFMNLIMQLNSEGQTEYRRYRVALNRKGIRGIERFDNEIR